MWVALVQWQLVLLSVWFLLFILRQVCDRLLEAAFRGLVKSVRGSRVPPSNVRGVQIVKRSDAGGSGVMEEDRFGAMIPSSDTDDDHSWHEYFADPSQWWDNRGNKRNLRAPDFKHRVSKKALWVDGWYTPKWAKERLL